MSATPRSSRNRRLVLAGLATAVGVVAIVILALAYHPSAPPECTALECAPAFTMGNPVGPTPCTARSTPSPACEAAGDYVYHITVESSSLPLGDFRFAVLTSDGSIYPAADHGGFFVLDLSGAIAASYELARGGGLAMPSNGSWTYYTATTGVSADTPLTSVFSIEVDVGAIDPLGQGLEMDARTPLGVTAPLQLP